MKSPKGASGRHGRAIMQYRRSIQGMNIGVALLAFALLAGVSACQRDDESATAGVANSAGVDSRPAAVIDIDQASEGVTQHPAPDAGQSVVLSEAELPAGLADQWPAARFSSSGPIPAETQRQGDVQAGRTALLEAAYVSCGLPERVFRQLLDDADVVEISGRTEAARGLPYSVNILQNDKGDRIVSSNCLTCHATPLFGELVVGLGNEFLDFTGDASAQAERAGLLVDGPAETAIWELFADRMAAIAPYIRPHTVGVNPANNLTAALIAHRHADDNAWSDTPLLPLPPQDPPPVSVPPWWRMQKKPAMFNMGEGRGDHARLMMSASMLCSDNIDELERIDAYAPDIRAFIASLEAPPWPFELDTALAGEGRQLFEQTCSRCHGSYGDQPEYPARLVPLDIIGTDPVLVEFARGEGAAYVDWFNRSYYGLLATAAPGPGYVAPPLDGIWSTAPFLHNGSVPSLRAVLDSGSRPVLWRHSASDASDPDSYDQVNMGWAFEIPAEDKNEAAVPQSIYDTRLPGYSNSGHRFGDHFDESQRSAVLEYLKTL
ncbi:c-type cytochrome [Granulosicoccus sp. 3-233]|uniref:c-type cytochrome n=1 Tax=Granulosicoccus sp. 3-233 TaxID=3417969 RepID=UPI003D357BF6